MTLDFGRAICGNLEMAEKQEWLVTNGIGGYASGTVANLLTRRYHGLLMAALQPPLGRTLLLAKLDETAEYDGIHAESGHYYPLYVNRWGSGATLTEPDGYKFLDRFVDWGFDGIITMEPTAGMELARRGHHVTAIDISSVAVDQVAEAARVVE